MVDKLAHNQKVAGSNPVLASKVLIFDCLVPGDNRLTRPAPGIPRVTCRDARRASENTDRNERRDKNNDWLLNAGGLRCYFDYRRG